ncbi:MAG: hypothetical protein LBQ33_00955, partial [Oscillospiraceae bacterium]|nr:hypothetical protein [Oscillospiraceae bacterium]
MPNNLTQALKRMKKPHKRCLAGLLSLLLVLSVAAVALPGTFAASNFTISIAWNGSDPAISGSSFTYDSTKAEEKLVRLKISYKNTAIAKEYPPGSLIITVPGLSGILRSGSGGATSIAADPASASYSSYDWNYTYNAGSDTYTFMNNFAVATGATFAGSFEMIWNIPSRSSVHGFTKHIQASFRTTRDFGSIQSNTLQYSQSRTKDQFTLLLTSEPLYSAEGYTAAGSTTDYTWFRYEATGAQHWYARGISSSAQQMNLVVPAGALVFGSGFVYAHPGSGADAGKDVWVRAESSLWLQQVAGGIYRREKFVIAYPKATYPEKTPLPVRIDALGIFYEEENQSLLCSASISNLAEDYDYTDIPGPIYDILKYSTGMHSAFVDAHDSESRRFGAINSTHMENSAREYSSTFPLTLNYFPAASPVSHYDYFDLEFVDDIMDVETTGGSLRRLRDDEYTFTRVTIPASSNLVNYNGFPLQPEVYEVELSVRYRGVTKPAGQGEDAYVKLTQSQYTGKKIGASPLEFVLPADVVGVRVLIKGLRESIKGNGYYVDYGNIVTVHYIFHTSSSDIRLNTGRVINNMYFKLYAPDSTGTRQWINPFTAAEYERSSEAQRDIDLYGAYLDREAAKLLILEIPNEVAVTNTIQKTDESRETFFFSGSITGRFSFQEGNETKLDHFSMYTLVPQGLYLSKTARDPEAFKRQISFNGTDGNGAALSDALLRSHCSIELIPDYQSSGQYYIALHFTDLDTNPATITVSGIPMFKPKETVGDVNFTVRMEAMLLIDQPGLWYANSTDGRGAPWTDIDRDSNSTEIAALSSSSLTFYNPENTNLQANKLVETILTDSYVLPWKDNELGHYEDSVPGSYLGEEYRYKLRIHLGESKASGFLFVDALETGPLKEWQGSFLGVDYSEAQALLGKTPQVYYSAAVETVYQTGTAFEPTVPGGNWVLASSWAQPLSAVKSVAVKFPEDAIAQPGAYVSVVIRMRAPADEATRTIVAEAADDNEDYLTENNYAIHYSELTMDDVYIGREHLPSNDVPVRLLPYVGVINLQKLDAEDGSPLAGAVFDVYRRLGASPNPATDRKVRSDQMTGSNGKLRITDLPYGDYYLIETAAPLGYKTPSSGDADYILAVELMDDDPGYEISLTVENRRKEGQVSLRKRSDLNNSYPVAGAEFALYRENGTPYPYPDAIVTDNYGELTLTGLPWGNYYLVETAAPYGFDLPAAADNKYPFTVAASTDAGHMVLLDIKNPQEPAEVWLLKLERLENNDPTTTPVDAAVYRLYEDNGDENFTNDTRVGAYATDENGKIYVGGLGYGSYYFKEYTAAEGYYINPDPIRFTLLPQDGTAGNNVIGLNESEANKTLTTYNRRLYGSIYLQKTDEAGVLMNGVEYGLYRAADDSLVEARKTGEELITEGPNAGQPAGEAWLQWNNVPWGEYYVKEISAPRGYEVNDSEIPVTVERWTVSKLY